MLSREIEGLAELLMPHRRTGLLLEPKVVGSLVAVFQALALQARVMEQMTIAPSLRGRTAKLGANVIRFKPKDAPR